MSKKGKALIIVAAALFLALGSTAAYFLANYRFVVVPTGSMANTIIPGDRVLCTRGAGEIKRGDIVMFKLPEDPKVMYMHRVIGLPGETIQVKGRSVFVIPAGPGRPPDALGRSARWRWTRRVGVPSRQTRAAPGRPVLPTAAPSSSNSATADRRCCRASTRRRARRNHSPNASSVLARSGVRKDERALPGQC